MTLTLQSVRDTILTHVDSVWADRTVIAWPNTAFTAPTDAPYAEIAVIFKAAKQIAWGETGKRLFRRDGMLQCRITVLPDSGTTTLTNLADAFLGGVEGETLSGGIRFFGGETEDEEEAAVAHSILISVPFSFDVLK